MVRPGRPPRIRRVPFSVSPRVLERLEWPAVQARLATHARTELARTRCEGGEPLFEPTVAGMRARLAETSEARTLLDAGEIPPLDGVRDARAWLDRAAKGGVLAPDELRDLGAGLAATAATARFLAARAGSSPALAALGEDLADHAALAADIDRCIDPEGEVRDAASGALAAARREARQLAGEVQRRIQRILTEPAVAVALQDAYFTVRGDRYVLPVRADSRARVPGIVHDASSSGTTLFVEPQAVVELNNRLKQAELAVEREVRRVLRELCERAGGAREEILASQAQLERIDLAFARGGLSREMDAVEPRVTEDGVFRLHQLRHPLLAPDAAVPNDLVLGESFDVLVVSGPNAGGKTVAMKALAVAALLARAGLHVPAAPGARVDAVERVLADIGDEQDIRESLSTFSAHMANLAGIVASADRRSLVALDEVGVGTDPGEGAALAQAVLEALADAGARVVATTHYNLLKEMAEVDGRFANASVEFDAETLAPTYRLTLGAPGASSATAVAARMGMPAPVLERAASLLRRDDRRLDRMLSELASSRATLERERREAAQLREQSEAARDAYRGRLERLQQRRDQLFDAMREDLDRAFRDAHAEVAGVIRTLQRGGGDAREAARARERLLALEAKARRAEEEGRSAVPETPRVRVDWRRARPGDPVTLRGDAPATLLSLPDGRGRVRVQAGTARLLVPADQLSPAAGAAPARPPTARVNVEVAPAEGVAGRLDLRGLRVDEAVDRVSHALDRAAGAGRARLEIVHGVGTGALRQAVRAFLRDSPYVRRIESGDPEHGGDGITTACLDD